MKNENAFSDFTFQDQDKPQKPVNSKGTEPINTEVLNNFSTNDAFQKSFQSISGKSVKVKPNSSSSLLPLIICVILVTIFGTTIFWFFTREENSEDNNSSPNLERIENKNNNSLLGTLDNYSSSFTEEIALSILTDWLKSKPIIFGSQYEQELLSDFLTGSQLEDSNNSLLLLQANDSYFTYTQLDTPTVTDFEFDSSSKKAIVIAEINEQYQVIEKGVQTHQGETREKWVYIFTPNSDGNYKISESGSLINKYPHLIQ